MEYTPTLPATVEDARRWHRALKESIAAFEKLIRLSGGRWTQVISGRDGLIAMRVAIEVDFPSVLRPEDVN